MLEEIKSRKKQYKSIRSGLINLGRDINAMCKDYEKKLYITHNMKVGDVFKCKKYDSFYTLKGFRVYSGINPISDYEISDIQEKVIGRCVYNQHNVASFLLSEVDLNVDQEEYRNSLNLKKVEKENKIKVINNFLTNNKLTKSELNKLLNEWD